MITTLFPNKNQPRQSVNKKMRERTRTEDGFTLIEILIALSIVAITLVALLTTLATSQENSVMSKMTSKATLLAIEKMNELEMGGYPVSENEDEEEEEIITNEGEFDDEGEESWRSEYYWQTVIKKFEGINEIKQVIVRVFSKRFRSREGEDYITSDYRLLVELKTYIAAKRPVQ